MRKLLRSLLTTLTLGVLMLALSGCFGIDFSPDGKRVAFMWAADSSVPGAAVDNLIAIINTDGTGFRYMPNSEGGGPPQWSTTGKYLAYEKDTKIQIQAVDLSSSETFEAEGQNGFTWSSKGEILEAITWEDDQRYAVWYDVAAHRTLAKLPLSVPAGGNLRLAPVPGSLGFVYGYDSSLWLVTPEEDKEIAKNIDIDDYRISSNGDRMIFSVNSPDVSKTLIRLYEYSFVDGKVRELPYANTIRDANVNVPSKPIEAHMICASPDLSKIILSVVYENKNPDGSNQARSFLTDTLGMQVVPLWLRGEQFCFADWSPRGDAFILWTPISMADRDVISIRWFTNDGSLGIPLLSLQSKRPPKDSKSSQ